MAFLGLVTIIFVIFAPTITRYFTIEAEVIPYAVNCLRIVSYGYIFYALGMVMVQAFNGAGDTYTPTVINFFCYWVFQIPLAYLLSLKLQMGTSGVFVAIAVAESVLAVVGFLVFRRGRWESKTI